MKERPDWISEAPFSRCYWSAGSLLDIIVRILVVVIVVADFFGTVDQKPQKTHGHFNNLLRLNIERRHK